MRNSLRFIAAGASLVVSLVGSSAAAAGLDDPRQEARQIALASERELPERALPSTRLLASTDVTRVTVGLHDRAELKRVARKLRAAGARVERLPELSAIASRGLSAASVVYLLRRDEAVTFIEQDRELAVLADPYDAVDPATGLNFNWAYDAIAAGPALAAVGGGSQFPVAVIDTGVDVGHADLAGRVVGSYSAVDGGAM